MCAFVCVHVKYTQRKHEIIAFINFFDVTVAYSTASIRIRRRFTRKNYGKQPLNKAALIGLSYKHSHTHTFKLSHIEKHTQQGQLQIRVTVKGKNNISEYQSPNV